MDNICNKKERTLKILAIIWFFASFNILKMAFESYRNITFISTYLICIISVYIFFLYIFSKALRNISIKTFLVMAFMMSMGIILRKFNLFQEKFIVIFYTGLGVALLSSSLKIVYNNFKKKI